MWYFSVHYFLYYFKIMCQRSKYKNSPMCKLSYQTIILFSGIPYIGGFIPIGAQNDFIRIASLLHFTIEKQFNIVTCADLED